MKINLLLLTGILVFSACKNKKDDEPLPAPAVVSSMTFKIGYTVDANTLIFDSLMYANDAGNQYSVYKLQYYLSQISLIKSDSSKVLLKNYQYVDAAVSSTNSFTIDNVPEGGFLGISFNIGIDSVSNITGGLPSNTENINMEWPVPMGGGYHFMKLEGNFMNGSTLTGFNMHLGMNENLVHASIFYPVFFNHSNFTYTMAMNLNEWFRNPAVYDFTIDGASSMSDSLAMLKLMQNGSDVFSHY